MLLVVGYLVFIQSLLTHQAALGFSNRACADGCPRGLTADFNGVANLALSGHGYRNLTANSSVLCGRDCAMDQGCFSFQYSDREKRCELNGATALRFPMDLKESSGTYYFEQQVEGIVRRLASMIAQEGHLSLTDCTYLQQELASAECQRTDQHLCLKWELQFAYEEGHVASAPKGAWYAEPDRQAVPTETGLTYQDPPLYVPSPALCCSRPMSYRSPVISEQVYDLADREGQANGCSALAAHPCTLAELKEAYLAGYRSGYWLYFAEPDRDASVDACTFYHTGSECYSDRLIPNTPRPASRKKVYCCANREE